MDWAGELGPLPGRASPLPIASRPGPLNRLPPAPLQLGDAANRTDPSQPPVVSSATGASRVRASPAHGLTRPRASEPRTHHTRLATLPCAASLHMEGPDRASYTRHRASRPRMTRSGTAHRPRDSIGRLGRWASAAKHAGLQPPSQAPRQGLIEARLTTAPSHVVLALAVSL